MILRLAHIVIEVDDLEAARAFYVDLLGFVEHRVEDDALFLRGSEEFDLWSLALVRAAGAGGLGHCAFRVASSSDLDSLAQLHDDLGRPMVRVPAGLEPGQGPALRVLSPDGHALEFVHEIDEIDPYEDGRLRLPMRTGAAGLVTRLDHVSLRVPSVPRSLEYWSQALAFSPSEYWLDENAQPRIAWLRRSPRSHDVALGTGQEAAFHHVAFAVSDPLALLRAADVLGDARLQHHIEWGPGRHGATNAFAMYVRDPAGNRLELYTGDYARDLDRPPLRWEPEDYDQQGHSWWGHPPPASFLEARPLRSEDWLAAGHGRPA